MHYYKFNIADWAQSTAHLSLEEEAIYFRLVNHYYDTEAPIPLETQWVIRRLRLGSHSEIVPVILGEFFTETEKGWVHSRCEKILTEYRKTRSKNRKNAALGGRPRKQRATEKPSGFPVGCQTKPDGIPNQEPLTTNHKPLTKNQEPDKNNTRPQADAGDFCEKSPPVPFQKIIDLYHKTLPDLPKCAKLTDTRRGLIRQRWQQDLPELGHWENYFDWVGQSDFLMGRSQPTNGRPPFRADLEWLCRPSNFAKITEKKYHGSLQPEAHARR